MTTSTADVIHQTFLTGLKNAHALEQQALALMDRQIDHLQNYQEVERRLREHRVETEGQIDRLNAILASFGESNSIIKDAGLSLSGNLAALAHVFAPDEIIKNSFANFAFENFEAASYMGLITLAEDGGYSDALPLLQQTLEEERAMAAWVEQSLPTVTRQFVSLRAAGQTASH